MLDFKNYSYSFLLHLLFILGFYILSYFFVHQNKISTSHLSINSVSVGMIDEGALESLNQELPLISESPAEHKALPLTQKTLSHKATPKLQPTVETKTQKSYPVEAPSVAKTPSIAESPSGGGSSAGKAEPARGTSLGSGTSTGTTATAMGAGNGGQGSVNEKYNYIKDILPMLSSLLHYPEELLEENIEGTSLVHFTINREGYIIDSKIYKSSGKIEFDESSLDLFKRLRRYKKFPDHWANNTESFILPVAYHIH